MRLRLFVLRVDIYEETRPFPVVRHEFRGLTKREARGYYTAHLKTDDFMRGCVEHGRFGTFRCRPEITTYGELVEQL